MTSKFLNENEQDAFSDKLLTFTWLKSLAFLVIHLANQCANLVRDLRQVLFMSAANSQIPFLVNFIGPQHGESTG